MHKKIIIALSSVFLAGCTSTIDQRGYNAETVNFSVIKPGVQNKDHVMNILGSPTTKSAFGKEKWFYITKVTSQRSFFEPTVLEEETVIITFNDAGVVESIEKKHGEDALAVQPNSQETKTAGYDTSIGREILGNFGRLGSMKPKKP